MLREHQIPSCHVFMLWYISTGSTCTCCTSYALAQVQGRSLSPIITFTRMAEPFPAQQHTRAIKPWGMIRRKKANCRCISRSWSIFPLSPPCNQGQRPKKDLLSTSGNCKYYLDLTMQCDQRDLTFYHSPDPECKSPEVESNLVFPQDLVRVVKPEQEVDLRR